MRTNTSICDITKVSFLEQPVSAHASLQNWSSNEVEMFLILGEFIDVHTLHYYNHRVNSAQDGIFKAKTFVFKLPRWDYNECRLVRGGEDEGHLPFLTVSFVALVHQGAPPLMLALQLGHSSRVLLDELAGLAVVFLHQLLHLFVLLPLLADEALLLLQLLQRLSLQL